MLVPVSPAPFEGGTLEPLPLLLRLSFTTSPAGGASVAFVMPAGFSSGTELWFQWAIEDAAAIDAVALSNAVKGVTP